MQKGSRIYIAGHRGMVGSAILRNLESKGFTNFLLRSSSELDLRDQQATAAFFAKERPEFVFLAAAKVGGIQANNQFRADFLYENLMIQNNVIHSSYQSGVTKLMFLGSSCIYPKMAPQPLKEEYLLSGYLEPTNEPYAIAKIAGIKMCESYRLQYGCDFISVMPTNLYGPNDNYNLSNSHVLPALIRKFHEAREKGEKKVVVWGSGSPLREFLHADDLGDACVYLMQNYSGTGHVNVGTGSDLTIRDLAVLIKKTVGFEGEIEHDLSKPDGTPRKLLDVSLLHSLGWKHSIGLEEGVRQVYDDFRKKQNVKVW
jgi:GDP-L-fucose synthase